jgi:serine protease Do
MKKTLRIWAIFGSGLASGVAAYLILSFVAVGNTPINAPPTLNIDTAPLARETKLATSFAPVIKQASPSVVNIYAERRVAQQFGPLFSDPMFRRFFGLPEEDPRPGRRAPSRIEQSLGSGVIVSEDGYILTNNHVVDGADEIKVVLPDGRTEYDARVIGRDPQTDVAVLKIEASDLPAIILTDSDKIEVGDVVLAIGNPFGVGQTVTMGIVSATGRGGFRVTQYEDFIQTDASINRGNSGGALLDAEGRLVGINTFIMSGTGGNVGLGFAIPINLARNVMELLIREGRVTRGYLGVRLQTDLTADLARALKLPDRRGALITDVEEGTPAAKAGLKEGDVIIEFNNRPVQDSRHLSLMVSQTPPKTESEIKLVRDGKERTFKITLGELPADRIAGVPAPPDRDDTLWGVELRDLTPDLRRQFSVPAGVQGALVLNVEPDSPAYKGGLQPGHVILEIARQPVSNAADAVRHGRAATGDTVLFRVWTTGGSRYLVVTPEPADR